MNRDVVIFLAVALAVLCPSLPTIGNPENIGTLILLITLLSSGRHTVIRGFAYSIAVVFILISISTIAGLTAVRGTYSVNPNSIGVYFRMVICFQAMQCVNDIPLLHRRLLWLGSGASLFAILQFFLSDVAAFTSAYYLSSDRATVFDYDFARGSIVRVIGFFESPSSVGLLSIVLILFSINAFSKGLVSRKTLSLFVALHLVGGFLSMSKIFFVGISVIIVQLLLLRYRLAILSITILAVVGIYLAPNLDYPIFDLVQYSLTSTLDPDAALNGRYLDEQLAPLANSRFFGYGMVAVNNININDSIYLGIGYAIGLVGAFVVVANIFWWTWRRRTIFPTVLYLVMVIVLIAGIGTNSIMGFRLDILLTALCATNLFSSSPQRNREIAC